MLRTDGQTAFLPDLIYTGGRFERGLALLCDETGRITRLAREAEMTGSSSSSSDTTRVVRLKGRALLPGLVNAHSHAFQRVIRGRTEHRTGNRSDTFWTWREMMYSAATRLTPGDIYDASRMAFLEMALNGIAAVGEFHYIHRTPEGAAYDDPNVMAKEVVRAARDVGLRIALLRVAYARSGYRVEPNLRQARFIETGPETYLGHVEELRSGLARIEDERDAWVGLAPHSVRAVPLDYLREVMRYGADHQMPIHMHVAEQPAEIAASMEEHGRTPVHLLADEGLLSQHFTGVHGIHVTPEEISLLARSRATVCACPTTERNLGDGIIPADALMAAGVRLSLGTDSHTQIDLLEDARELEYHLRLQRLERNVLAPEAHASSETGAQSSALAARLFDCATRAGAQSIHASNGELEPGHPADFFAVDLNDPSIAGASPDDLLSCIVFSLARTAVREVFVGGRAVIEEGQHRAQDEIVENFGALQRKLWS
ncbi:MAG: formimidoylglutamate deiminase [Pyrinomonadaceae bacterium]